MQTVNIQAAKTQLSRLVALASAEESQPPVRRQRVLGILAGQLSVPDSFGEPLPDDLLDVFEGR
jgi:hypothetical protein